MSQAPPPEPLIRIQAQAAARRRLWGDLLLTQPPGTGLTLLALLFFTTAAAAMAWWGEFARTERVYGYLVPEGGVLLVEAPQSGLVQRVAVREGETVASGQVLIEIRDPRVGVAGSPGAERALTELAAERARLDEVRSAEIARFEVETRALAAALARFDGRVASLAAQRRIVAAEHELVLYRRDALRDLHAAGHVAPRQLEAVERERLRLEERIEQLHGQQLLLAAERSDTAERLAALPSLRTVRLAELDDRRSRLEREAVEVSLRWRFVLKAPMAGRVAALSVETGDAVRPGRTLLTLLAPDASMQAILLVPSRAAGFIQPGQSVRMRYAAFPQARFGTQPGTVVSVSSSVLSPAQVAPPGRAEEPVYKVRVRPERDAVTAYGRRLPLQAGMALEADVELERRRLLHWILDPLLALRGRL